MSIANIISNTKTRISAVLGNTYTELAYSNNVSKNSFKGNFKRYGLLAGEVNEISGTNRYSTMEQSFEIILTDSYINTAMSDAMEVSKGPVLQELAYSVYRDLIKTRCGNSSVVIVKEFQCSKPETLDEAVIIRATFKVVYRSII